MIIQPKRNERNVNDMFYASEKAGIEKLNECFFADIDLTKDENKVLVWLCGWDWFTHNNIVSAFEKVLDKNTQHKKNQYKEDCYSAKHETT